MGIFDWLFGKNSKAKNNWGIPSKEEDQKRKDNKKAIAKKIKQDQELKEQKESKKQIQNDKDYVYNSLDKSLYKKMSKEFEEFKLFMFGIQEKLWPGEIDKEIPRLYFGSTSNRLYFPLDEKVDFWYKFILEMTAIEQIKISNRYIPNPIIDSFKDPIFLPGGEVISPLAYEDNIFKSKKIQNLLGKAGSKMQYYDSTAYYGNFDLNKKLAINIQENYEILILENKGINELLKRIVILNKIYSSLLDFQKKCVNDSFKDFLKRSAIYDDEYERNISLRIMHSKAVLYSIIIFALEKGLGEKAIIQAFQDFENDKKSLKDIDADCLKILFDT